MGAVGIFQIYGGEQFLAGKIDASLVSISGQGCFNSLKKQALRYGKLVAASGGELDEVLLAKPKEGQRSLMCHGGTYICAAISAFLQSLSLRELTIEQIINTFKYPENGDMFIDPFLAGCLTSSQAAAVLEARSGNKDQTVADPSLFMLHHLCLAGPPNVGKSSLLNCLSGYTRALVHADAGATRDIVSETVDLAGYAVLVEDLPGYACDDSVMMQEAWQAAERALALSEIVAFICDQSRGWDKETEAAACEIASLLASTEKKVIVVLNKIDLPTKLVGKPWNACFHDATVVKLCAIRSEEAEQRFAAALYTLLHDNKNW